MQTHKQMKPFSFCIVLLVTLCKNTCKARPSEVTHERFDLKILENGTQFRQEVDLEEDEGIVTVHVPQHNNVDETYFITDTNKHLTMRVAPQQKMCFLTKNDPEELPSAEVWRKTRATVQDSFFSSRKVETQEIVYQMDTKLSEEEKTSLPQRMRESCAEFPVIFMDPIHSSSEQTEELRFSKDNFTFIDMPNREKRHAGDGASEIFVDTCPSNKIKQKCLLKHHGCNYAYDRICDTHVDVSGRESMQCNLNHWSGQVICCKPCCLDQVPDGNPSLHCHDPRLHRDAICE